MLARQDTKTRARKAFTLTELAIVLAGAGVVMAAVWGIVGTVWESYRFNKMNEQVMMIVQNVREHFGPKGRITFADGAITADLDNDNFRLIPVTMRVDPKVAGGTISHALAVRAGGSLTVDQLNGGRSFRITLNGLSRGNCTKLLVQFPVTMPELGVIRLQANATTIAFDPRNPAALPVTIPVSAAAASGYCSLGNNANVVAYDFRLFP